MNQVRWSFALAKVLIHSPGQMLDVYLLWQYRDTPLQVIAPRQRPWMEYSYAITGPVLECLLISLAFEHRH